MANIAEENSPVTLGAMIDRLAEVRDQRRVLKEQDKVLVAEFEALTEQVLQAMDEQGVPKLSGFAATASVTEQELYNISDFDDFAAYIIENDALYLMQRRPAQAAIAELAKMGTEVPGLVKFTKRGLNLRKSKT